MKKKTKNQRLTDWLLRLWKLNKLLVSLKCLVSCHVLCSRCHVFIDLFHYKVRKTWVWLHSHTYVTLLTCWPAIENSVKASKKKKKQSWFQTLRWRSVSRDFSLSQSMVWKSSYVATSGNGSSRKSIRFPAPFISSVGVALLTPDRHTKKEAKRHLNRPVIKLLVYLMLHGFQYSHSCLDKISPSDSIAAWTIQDNFKLFCSFVFVLFCFFELSSQILLCRSG